MQGKRFPDSLTKTVPIWACVLNRAIARHRASAAGSNCHIASQWDTALHVPEWIPATEKAQIEERLEGWVERLLVMWPQGCKQRL